MKTKLAFLTILITMLISPLYYSEPGFNGIAPGCGGSGCHTSQVGIVSVTNIGNLQVRVTITGIPVTWPENWLTQMELLLLYKVPQAQIHLF